MSDIVEESYRRLADVLREAGAPGEHFSRLELLRTRIADLTRQRDEAVKERA